MLHTCFRTFQYTHTIGLSSNPQRGSVLRVTCTMTVCLQIDPQETKSTLTLFGLSPYDNGRVIVCSAENMVGQTEATIQLNILCEPFCFAPAIIDR